MDTQKINLDWHVICGALEIEELIKSQDLKIYPIKNDRHKLFLAIKHPATVFYTGSWGPETLHFKQGQGKICSTDQRSKDIAAWIRDRVFL